MYKQYFKRPLDILMSALLFVVFLPVSFAVAIAIKLDSVGPIFADTPKRVGQHGRQFKMFKFRSMVVNAHDMMRQNPEFAKLFEEFKNNSFKLQNDPRVTKVGRFIRKYSLDEVPQLLNVMRGEMSLVGPRAYYQDELDHQLEKFPHVREDVEHVLSARPGITGLWQVSGRSEINFDKRIKIDNAYAQEVSLCQDLKIIIKTPLVMLTGRGAS